MDIKTIMVRLERLELPVACPMGQEPSLFFRGSEIKLEIKAPTYFPTNERMPETPPPNFEKPVDLDLFKGLGSLLATTRKDFIKK